MRAPANDPVVSTQTGYVFAPVSLHPEHQVVVGVNVQILPLLHGQSRSLKLEQHIGGCGKLYAASEHGTAGDAHNRQSRGLLQLFLLPEAYCLNIGMMPPISNATLLAAGRHQFLDQSPAGKASSWCSIRQITACTPGAASPTSEFMPAKPLRLSTLALGSLASASWLSILPEKQAVSCREQRLLVYEVAA